MAPLIFLLTSEVLAPHQCDTDPVGWDSLRELFVRDTEKHGVTYSMSTDLTFVKRAAAYIRLVYEGGTDQLGNVIPAQGVEGLVALTVFEQDPNELRPAEIYRGKLDFTTYSSAESGVTARFKEPTFATALATRADAEVDLLGAESLSGVALPSYAPIEATLHSQQTLQRFDMEQVALDTNLQSGAIAGTDAPEDELSTLLFFGMDTVKLNEFGISSFATGPISGDSYNAVNVPFYTAKESGAFTITLNLTTTVRVVQVSGASFQAVDIKYHYRKNGSPATATELITRVADTGPFPRPVTATAPALVSRSIDKSYQLNTGPRTFTETMEPGDRLYLYGEVFVHDFNGGPFLTEVLLSMGVGSYLKVSAPTTTASTTCAGLLVHEVLQRCCEAATDTRDAFYSEFYGRTDTRLPYQQDGPGAYRFVTNGFYLRGFPLLTAPAPAAGETDTRKGLSLSLDTAYEGFNAIDCLGQGIEQRDGKPVVRIEPRAYFYQSATVLELGAVNELKKGVCTDWLYNEAQVGYAHWQSGAPNGLDEFNGLRTYSLPLTQLKKTYTAVSTLNAAGYLIEEARRDRYAAGSTKEGKADAEPFVICVTYVPASIDTSGPLPVSVPAHYASQTTQGFVAGSIGGILSADTAYNLPLAPGRMLRAHGPWLRAGLSAQTTKRLLLGKTEGNAHLVSQRTGEAAPLPEFADVPVTDLAAPLVLAEPYEFTVRLRRGQMARLKANPYGRISFLDGLGQRKAGYLLRAERAPQSGLTTFTLLRAAV